MRTNQNKNQQYHYGKKACLCRDSNTYSRSCCNEHDQMAQGIGKI